MKGKIFKLLVAVAALFLGAGTIWPISVSAEGEEMATSTAGTSISLTPISKILQISSASEYNESFTVNNDGDASIRVEVYAAPYSYVYSAEEDLYKLGFSNENNFTQISRWITFQDINGNYVEKAFFSIEPRKSLEINFRITTPNNIPSGGQYAVIFAHTLSNPTSGSGIRTEVSPGMVVYGRSTEGEASIDAEISDLEISGDSSNITANAKVKNIGNVDFTASGTLRIDPIIGFSSYETPANIGRVSIIPDAELFVADEWHETPTFGIYKATWTIVAGDDTKTIEKTIFKIPLFVIIIFIIVLTIIIISIIMAIRKRKMRRSRFSA